MYRHSMALGIALILALGLATPHGGARAAGRDDANPRAVAMLKKIASRLGDRTGVISIEATDPVAYVASQPDPSTFVIELRDVLALGFADNFKADPRLPFATVQVDSAHAEDGVTIARVRMTLSAPQRPTVRSSRNVIYVEAERVDASPSKAGMISMAGPSSAIRDIRVSRRGDATAVTLLGTSRLVATDVQEPKGGRRLILDLPNVTSAVANNTNINQGPVERVRVGFNPRTPLMMQVTFDLSRQATYRLESSADGSDLTVVFDEPAADPFSALRSTPGLAAVPPPAGGSAGPALQARRAGPLDPPTAAAQDVVAPQIPVAQQPDAVPPPPPAQPAAAQAPAITLSGPRPCFSDPPVYTGTPVSLDFNGTDVRAVLRVFSDVSGLNMVIDPGIQAVVDLNLRDVPWDQALDIVLRANRLGCEANGTILRIAPLGVLQDEQAQRQKLAEAQALAGELRVLTRSLSYARAEDLRALITATALSQRGTIQTDPRTNTIIINDLPDRLQRAAAVLDTLDRPEPQVEIEARIVQTNRSFARQLGVQWGFNGRATPELGNTLPFAFPNQATIGGRTGTSQGPLPPAPQTEAVPNTVNLGVAGASSAVGLALGAINGALNLDVALSALERSGQGRILSTPRVSTQNNIEAEIMQGLQIPIQTVANNTVTVTFREAALILRVTPQITAANTVIMRIVVDNSTADFSRQVNDIPPIDTQRANTQVLVANGETTVIGGIYVTREQTTQDRTPVLHQIPLLGWLFKRNDVRDESQELLIFITPRIMRL